MSRKRKHKPVEAAPEEVLAEGSGPAASVVQVGVDAIGVGVAADLLEAAAAVAGAEAEVAAARGEVEAAAADPGAFDGIASPGDPGDDGVEAGMADGSPDEADGPELGEGAPEGEGEGDGELALGAALPTSAASMDAAQLRYLVEALVFASDKPLTVPRLRQLTRVSDTRRLEQALAELAEDYRERGLVLQQVSGGYQFRTRTQFSGWVQQLIAGRPVRLSRAQLETLAIIAYRQPITRPEIDNIRGVDSSATLKLLIDRALIRILGKKEEVGRPMLYGTTKEFLDFFSLGDLRELPTLREYSELTDESRKVMSDRLGLDPSEAPVGADEDPDGGGGGGGGDGSGGDDSGGVPPQSHGSPGAGEGGADAAVGAAHVPGEGGLGDAANGAGDVELREDDIGIGDVPIEDDSLDLSVAVTENEVSQPEPSAE